MLWLLLAFLSATLLGFYDVFKKLSLKGNAILPVLFLNTVFSSLIFIPFILGSRLGWFRLVFAHKHVLRVGHQLIYTCLHLL